MRYLVILLVVIIPVLFTSCDEALLSELDTLAAENEEQAVADSLLNARLDSLLTIIIDQQVYIDSLITVQNTNNATQLALIEAQQTTLTALENSALNAGFIETQVFNGLSYGNTNWIDLDLSHIVGNKTSIVLIKLYNITNTPRIALRPYGTNDEWADSGNSITMFGAGPAGDISLALITTGNNGVIQWKIPDSSQNGWLFDLSIIFYLN